MSVSGPSPLGTLMVQRVEAALGVTVSQQANIAAGARPDAVTQPGQPDKTEALKNPPPKDQEGARQSQGRQSGLAALARNNPEVARLLAARNAPMTSYTASAPTSLGQAAKAILALLHQFPDAKPAVSGRAPLLTHSPGQGSAGGRTGAAGTTSGAATPGAASAGTTGNPAAAGSGAAGTTGGAATPGAASAGTTDNPAAAGTGTAGATGSAASPTANPTGGSPEPRTAEAQPPRAAEGGRQAATSSQASPANTGAAAHTATAQRASGAAVQPGPTALSGQPGSNAPTTGSAPSLAAGSPSLAPTSVAGQLAQALSHAMQSSGLFYESHLREFTFGQRSLEQMRSEPQAQAGRETGGSAQSGAAQARGAGETAGSPAQTSQPSQTGQQAQSQSTAQPAQTSAQLAGALLSMDPATHGLVRQQLETLANQAFAWQGEAWPGGELEWEVRRREPQGESEETDNWSTRLKLRLPGLGEVVARLSLSETQLVMHLAAPESASLMADHTGLLRERLSLHGLQLSQLTISRESESGGEEQQ